VQTVPWLVPRGEDGQITGVQLGGYAGPVPYDVQTQVFEGPFDLLLHLILREEVDLYEISLSRIVDEFVAYVEHLDVVDLDVATEFLLIAATLVELKTRRLLPGDDALTLDEELAIWSERDLLLARLVGCTAFKVAASALVDMAVRAGRSLPRVAGLDERYFALAPDPMANVTPESLRAAFVRAVTPKPIPMVDLDHVAPIRASVTDAVVEISDELRRIGHIGFRALTASLATRLEVVVRFLAVLELFKQGRVELDQPTSFGDIHILWLGDESSAEGDAWDAGLTLVDAYDG
jgi:segregation and condensation protein A